MNPGKYLSEILKRGASNFDVLRLVAALGVIIGHAYALAPQPPLQDGISSILHFDYSGSLAVKFFFFLSGLLVTNSIISKPDPFVFILKRIFRIFPGLLICLLAAIFIIGPLFTQLPLGTYFSDSATWKYLTGNFFLLDLQWRLPGVFTESNYGLNGSLWTLPYEALCYIYLAIFYGLGLLKNKIVANIFFGAIVVVSFVAPTHLPPFFSQNPDSTLLPACFAIGALFANNKSYILINISRVILVWLFVVVSKHTVAYQFIFYIAFFYTAIFIASLDFVIKRLSLPFDASYGVYVYGFMVQQCIHALFPSMGVHGNQFLAAIISIGLGILSWYVVEKRFIELGNKLSVAGSLKTLTANAKNYIQNAALSWPSKKTFTGNNTIAFFFFTFLAIIIHAIVLKFVFPGYYSPFYPQHSDFYVPAAFANSNEPIASFKGLLAWPRPVLMIYLKLSGYFGIKGSIASTILVICSNCALTTLLIKRIFKIPVNWQLIVSFILYCFLLFSQSYFYIFSTQDAGAQLSFLFLLLGAHCYYSTYARSVIVSNALLFCFCLLAFLSKETYGLAMLLFTALWFIYYRKTSLLQSMLPFTIVTISLIIAVAVNILLKSAFIDPNASAQSAYHISLSPLVIFQEWFRYAREALNIANIIIIILLGYLLIKARLNNKYEITLVFAGCILAAAVSWLPNAILPNHHYKGYSFNGAYLFYLPLLLLPMVWFLPNLKKAAIAIAILCLISPLLNISKYKDGDNQWVLIQEDTQRNLLKDLGQLIKTLVPSPQPQKILIQGIKFPFHPFAFPESLRVFPNAKYATFDIINFNPSSSNNKRTDLVQFIAPADSNMVRYDQKWVFDDMGKLIKTENLLAERVIASSADSNEVIQINQENLSKLAITGFYDAENGIRWTNGNASIELNEVIENKDSIIVQLNTYMPPICKSVTPKLSLSDINNLAFESILTTRKGDTFYYLFVLDKTKKFKKINIQSETIDASPDQRVLSFPFVSLKIDI